MEKKAYRKNVGIVVFNCNGEVLVGERTNHPGAWQFPQGGMDDGEKPLVAARRELYEEVGILDADLVREHKDWIYYDFPPDLKLNGLLKKFKGQQQKWFLFYWDRPASACKLDVHKREFDRVKFIPFEESVESIVAFKKTTYRELANIFLPIVREYLDRK